MQPKLPQPSVFCLTVWSVWLAGALVCFSGAAFGAEADEALRPPRPRPDAPELRQRGRLLSPEERQRLFRESFERRGGTNWAEWQKRREEFRSLTPGQREARMRELRERPETVGPGFRVLTPQERETKRKDLKERVEGQIKALKARQADGTLTEAEGRRLERMQQMSKNLEQGKVLGRRPSPEGGPREEKPTDALPPPSTGSERAPVVAPGPPKPPPGR
jgi:hypothetical protein